VKLALSAVAAAVLLFVACPIICNGNTFEHARQMATLSNAVKLSRAIKMYVTDAGDPIPGKFRTGDDLRKLLSPYVDDSSFETLNPNGGEFVPNPGVAGKSLADIQSPAQVIVLTESEAWPDGRTVVGYADGHGHVEGPR
jgi:hypothetical protein